MLEFILPIVFGIYLFIYVLFLMIYLRETISPIINEERFLKIMKICVIFYTIFLAVCLVTAFTII